MKSKRILFLVLLCAIFVIACSGCAVGENVYQLFQPSGELGSFSLVSPIESDEVDEISKFSWTASENASTYTLEVCSSQNFLQIDDKVYIKKTGITTTEYCIGANIKDKNTTYYWRVTAVNKDGKKLCDGGIHSFYYKAKTDEEIPIAIEYADEWTVHQDGSNANVSIDNTNFFGNNQNSLVVSFVSEDTKQGVGHESSDGWMVITHQIEKEMYGVNAFYFNFYYSGNDADIYLRVVDEDNEYWNAQIKLANNAKQTAIIGFDEFTLRTKGGTTIANQVFDYNYIKYVELVFEKSFGDGVAMISDLKAVNIDNYSDMFIDKMDFSTISTDSYIHDNYTFATTVSEDGSAFSYSYSGINGYGFVKLPINKHLVASDAFSVNMKYNGASTTAKVLFRLIEEDGDRWVYEQNVSSIPQDGNMIVPFSAFSLSECNGDGARQFYYIKQFQFGISGVYGTGSVTFADLQAVTLADNVENLYTATLSDDGVIEDFDDYSNQLEMYYKWSNSTSNKDEQMFLDSTYSFGAGNTCGKFTYKSDMGPASYGLYFTGKEGFNALQVCVNDKSAKISEESSRFNYLTQVSAQMILSIYLTDGEEYTYKVNALNKDWTNYTVCFSDFTADASFFGERIDFVSENIAGIKIGIQYYYYLQDGSASPVYTSKNAVYFDDIALVNASESSQELLVKKLTMDENKICKIDDFEEKTLGWSIAKQLDYAKIEFSDETSTGIGQSMMMQYKGSESVAYATAVSFDSSVSAKAITLLLKGDGKATVYVNISMITSSGTSYKFRATISDVSADWTKYTISFDKFVMVEGTGSLTLASKYISNINKISFGIVDSDGTETSCIYVDDIALDGNASYGVFTSEKVGQ